MTAPGGSDMLYDMTETPGIDPEFGEQLAFDGLDVEDLISKLKEQQATLEAIIDGLVQTRLAVNGRIKELRGQLKTVERMLRGATPRRGARNG